MHVVLLDVIIITENPAYFNETFVYMKLFENNLARVKYISCCSDQFGQYAKP